MLTVSFGERHSGLPIEAGLIASLRTGCPVIAVADACNQECLGIEPKSIKKGVASGEQERATKKPGKPISLAALESVGILIRKWQNAYHLRGSAGEHR
ncbi:hypothetical protein [Bradyrhizobium sp. USDA 336]|uniref:hypothetical protein n=1 Tax=Bradyrhizobium sp. USDA 336 TaxID=3156311 RepID=UPI0038363968